VACRIKAVTGALDSEEGVDGREPRAGEPLLPRWDDTDALRQGRAPIKGTQVEFTEVALPRWGRGAAIECSDSFLYIDAQ